MALKRNQFGTGPNVSLFTLGTMRANESIEQMYSVVKEAYLTGINHLETAPAYGTAENLLGTTIKKLNSEGCRPEGGWIITSKILPGTDMNTGKDQLQGILSRLDISKIHNLAIHGMNLPEHLEWALNGDGAKLIKWATQKRLIGQVGFSSHGTFSLIKKAIESHRFQFCSLHLHLLDQERLPLAKMALERKLGVMAISPADKGGHLQTPSKTLISDCHPISPLELAYRFLLSQGISTLTLGASKITDFQIAKKLINSNSPLSKSEEDIIEKLTQHSKERLGNTFCGQCRDCLPCPNEVPIPEILRLRNLCIGMDLNSFTKERYNLIGRAGHWWEKNNATACQNCGECLPRCPNNLNIPDLLKDTHRKLVDTPKKRLWG